MSAGFDYDLPAELIAQHPAAERDGSRLMSLGRVSGEVGHKSFRDLPGLLRPGDLLVLNDTRVLPARLAGRREATGGRWEGLYLGEGPDGTWELLAKTRGRPAAGEVIVVGEGLRLKLVGRLGGHWLAEPEPAGDAAILLARHGSLPLPPYIRDGVAAAEDADRYQTVFAARAGAVAAPTAGLHFTDRLLAELAAAGVNSATVTLHVGLGTFEPVRGDAAEHEMHAEWCERPAAAAASVAACRAAGGRVVAVGTTVVRALEAAFAAAGPGGHWAGQTRLFIRPGYEFRAVDAVVTNFHLPRTTLLLLVAAFAGPENLRRAYEAAVAERYRFYSYGDAMIIQ